MSHHTQTAEARNPGPFLVSPKMKMVFGVCAILGTVATAIGLYVNPQRTLPSYLVSYFFFLSLALCGGFFTALQHITNAYWSVTVRRLAESLLSYLPVALLLAVPLILGRHHLWEWTHPNVTNHDAILNAKSSYLNTGAWVFRLGLFFALWLFLGFKMRKNSVAQDTSGDHRLTLSNIKLGTIFIPVFAFSFSLTAVDLLMSLEPHWFSTIYGVYCFAGLFFSGLSLLAILIISGRAKGLFTEDMVNANHLHDVGKLMFGFTVFWGYIMFSQLMLIWYANIPEETPYYIRRFHGGWWPYAIVLFMVHFVVPFFGLLPREAKRSDCYLKKMATLMLVAQWMDVYYLVMPVFFPEGPVFGWVEFGTLVGFMGIFGISVGRFLEKVPAIPIKDPRLAQCLAHSQ